MYTHTVQKQHVSICSLNKFDSMAVAAFVYKLAYLDYIHPERVQQQPTS